MKNTTRTKLSKQKQKINCVSNKEAYVFRTQKLKKKLPAPPNLNEALSSMFESM
ncbi:hypothetical protein ACE6H2_006689 [Prunus campanulata]